MRKIGYCLAVVLVVLVVAATGPVLWARPEWVSSSASALLGWLPHEGATPEQVRELGGQLTAGAIVAFAVVLVERLAAWRFARAEQDRGKESEKLERRREEEDKKRDFRLMIGLQKDLTGIDLESRDLKGYFLRGKQLTEANLEGADVTGADLSGCGLVGARFSGATLHGTAFVRAEMRGALLIGAKAGGARMRKAQLYDAVLDGANLEGGDLRGADLRRAWMNDCESLEKADLRGANLLETRMVDGSFDGVDLDGATLDGAYLIGADLSGALNLNKATLTGARYDRYVLWPEGFNPAAAGARYIEEDRNELLARLREENVEWFVDQDGRVMMREEAP